MILDRVTITGADDSVDPSALPAIAAAFPFVEWGILVSKSSEGGPRFPPRAWIAELLAIAPPSLALSLHVCGRWVRDLMLGHDTLRAELGVDVALERFQRVQLNFHAERTAVDWTTAYAMFRVCYAGQQLILQMDGVNDEALMAMRGAGLDVVPLYDTSGGAGVVPAGWPVARELPYQGYAGGLGPDTLERQLPAIAQAAMGARIWIDMERRVRSDDDQRLELHKVRRVLQWCAPYVAPR